MGSADRGPVATFIMSLIYLGFYAHMGVLTRVYLDRFVTLGCSATSWGPCWVSYNWPGGLYGLYTSVLVRVHLHCVHCVHGSCACHTSTRIRLPTCLDALSLASSRLHNSSNLTLMPPVPCCIPMPAGSTTRCCCWACARGIVGASPPLHHGCWGWLPLQCRTTGTLI